MVILKNPLLVAFETVCELKTIHGAARELGLTQAAITKRIQALEKDLGTSLFLRSRRGMTLTEEGSALRHYCRTTQEAEGALLAKLGGTERQETTLTIVGPTSAISTRIAENCLPLYKKYPFLRLQLRSDDGGNLIEIVRRGEADFAIVPPSTVPNEMESKMLKPDRFLLVGTAKWQGRELKDILRTERIIDFNERDETTFHYLKHFGLEKYVGRTRLFVNENEALIRFLENGVGYGTVTESLAKPHLDAGHLLRLNRGQSKDLPLALAWYARSKDMMHFQDIVRHLK